MHTQSSWQTRTLIGAAAADGVRGFLTIEGGTSKQVFEAFVEKELAPRINPGEVVVMDNLSVHKSERVRELIEAAGAQVLFIPPYSPEFNAIEKMWSKLKEALRQRPTQTEAEFEEALAQALDLITPADLLAWTIHCGYSLKSA